MFKIEKQVCGGQSGATKPHIRPYFRIGWRPLLIHHQIGAEILRRSRCGINSIWIEM